MRIAHYCFFLLAVLCLQSMAVPVAVGNLSKGVTGPENGAGTAYLLYSEENVHSRFQTWGGQANHFMLIQWDGNQWHQFKNEVAHPFTPIEGDVIIASLDLTNDTADLAVGESEMIHGILKGVNSTNLVITPNWWNGGPNPNEFGLSGNQLDLSEGLQEDIVSGPAWWYEGDPPAVKSGVANVDNNAVANVGQGKWMTMQALASIPDPAIETAIRAQIIPAVFTDQAPAPSDLEGNFSPLNLGQLKAMAKPFYDELNKISPVWVANQMTNYQITVYQAQPGLDAQWGYTEGGYYPWDPAQTGNGNNSSPANLGQLKAVFALELQLLAPPDVDTDGDGMPDYWEGFHGLNPHDSSDRLTDADGDKVANLMEYRNQTSANTNSDGDSDGLPDDWEVAYDLDPSNGSDSSADPDLDDLTNAEEFFHGTDPFDKDTDDDFVPDGVEANA